jgi:hypothetical protein
VCVCVCGEGSSQDRDRDNKTVCTRIACLSKTKPTRHPPPYTNPHTCLTRVTCAGQKPQALALARGPGARRAAASQPQQSQESLPLTRHRQPPGMPRCRHNQPRRHAASGQSRARCPHNAHAGHTSHPGGYHPALLRRRGDGPEAGAGV